ncbi:MAG TPA: aromatic-ring-hydroxylating dioxygenase subunit beta [Acetobacteraceae bacterium]|nr:aromatic-ring-hydroxylating dioxygenase subunit beta [Acetobacteraceae bacterium]
MTEAELASFVRHEARLIDEARWEEWLALFAEDGIYWVPLVPGQRDGIQHASLAYEDRLLLRIRIERLRDPHAHAQHPPSRCHHLLGLPECEAARDGIFEVRTPFHYTESRGDAQEMYVGTVRHHIVETGTGPRIRLKRVDLLNCDAALPSIQLFP